MQLEKIIDLATNSQFFSNIIEKKQFWKTVCEILELPIESERNHILNEYRKRNNLKRG